MVEVKKTIQGDHHVFSRIRRIKTWLLPKGSHVLGEIGFGFSVFMFEENTLPFPATEPDPLISGDIQTDSWFTFILSTDYVTINKIKKF
ncbi:MULTISPECIES: hypothetical protein [unclassified Thermoactinomyces]|jgi:hypothetical protein|uniref:hypothetical protein n=1 Tax=unclassified Thermoactinomyces TaxID=2634588 RepID=UPI0018DDF936|nr:MULTISPECIES: hypothetical protein [unclassified Thermoactinomyces]MBH8599590.1 hypothetical protein [Thermoactinomyces sp. CICC 10523]MBH8605788.1 hypothetical protein [Thermoactinomyces sp. CICC 10522]